MPDMKCSVVVHQPGCPCRMSCRPPSQNKCSLHYLPSVDTHRQHTRSKPPGVPGLVGKLQLAIGCSVIPARLCSRPCVKGSFYKDWLVPGQGCWPQTCGGFNPHSLWNWWHACLCEAAAERRVLTCCATAPPGRALSLASEFQVFILHSTPCTRGGRHCWANCQPSLRNTRPTHAVGWAQQLLYRYQPCQLKQGLLWLPWQCTWQAVLRWQCHCCAAVGDMGGGQYTNYGTPTLGTTRIPSICCSMGVHCYLPHCANPSYTVPRLSPLQWPYLEIDDTSKSPYTPEVCGSVRCTADSAVWYGIWDHSVPGAHWQTAVLSRGGAGAAQSQQPHAPLKQTAVPQSVGACFGKCIRFIHAIAAALKTWPNAFLSRAAAQLGGHGNMSHWHNY